MRTILPEMVKTVLLYGAAFVALLLSDRLNPSASDAGVGQSLMVFGVVALVLLVAFAYAFYNAVTKSPQWWAIVGLHIVLAAISLIVMMR